MRDKEDIFDRPLTDLEPAGLSEIKLKIQRLRGEVNCRIEHGAESGGHLEYVQERLDEILNERN